MKNILFFWMVTFLSASAFAQQLSGDEIRLRYLKEVEWPRAYREQDTVRLDLILAEEFEMIDANGNWYTKQDELDYIKSHKPSYDSFRFEIKRLRIFENGTAIVAGTGHILSTDDKGHSRTTYQSSNILINRNGTWKAISSHVFGVKTEPVDTKVTNGN